MRLPIDCSFRRAAIKDRSRRATHRKVLRRKTRDSGSSTSPICRRWGLQLFQIRSLLARTGPGGGRRKATRKAQRSATRCPRSAFRGRRGRRAVRRRQTTPARYAHASGARCSNRGRSGHQTPGIAFKTRIRMDRPYGVSGLQRWQELTVSSSGSHPLADPPPWSTIVS
jgi:hypothetical protein